MKEKKALISRVNSDVKAFLGFCFFGWKEKKKHYFLLFFLRFF